MIKAICFLLTVVLVSGKRQIPIGNKNKWKNSVKKTNFHANLWLKVITHLKYLQIVSYKSICFFCKTVNSFKIKQRNLEIFFDTLK
jgi:hypothetical protein